MPSFSTKVLKTPYQRHAKIFTGLCFEHRAERVNQPDLIRTIARLVPEFSDARTATNRGRVGSLQKQVRKYWASDLDNSRSGIFQPKIIDAHVPGVGEVQMREVSWIQGVVVGGPEEPVDIYTLRHKSTDVDAFDAIKTGSIPPQRASGDHFNNVSANLDYEMSHLASKLALGTFIGRATHNVFHD